MKHSVYTVYQTTNLINGKFYIGIHKTTDPNDDYVGSGVAMTKAVAKYGRQAFTKKVLHEFDSETAAAEKEKELIALLCSGSDTYNIHEGGKGGFGYLNASGKALIGSRKILSKLRERCAADPEFRARMVQVWKDAGTKAAQNPVNRKRAATFHPTFASLRHSDETKKKMSEAGRKRVGVFNGRTGKVWICNPVEMKVQVVPKNTLEQFIASGWILGRKLPRSLGDAALS